MRAPSASPAFVDWSGPFTAGGVLRGLYRGLLGFVGLWWACAAFTLCGCNSVNGWVMNESGKAYYRRGDYTAARHEFERALMDSPQNPHYAYNVAAAMQLQGDAMASERMYQHAITLDPGHQPAYEGLAHLLHKQGRGSEAQQLLTAWSETQPYVADSGIALSRLQQEQGDYNGAELSLRRAIAANPRHRDGLAEMGRLQRRLGRRRGAAWQEQNSLMTNPYQPGAPSEFITLNQHSGAAPSLLMAQQMPLYDPTYQPVFFSAAPGAVPYGGGANLAGGGPTIYPQLNQNVAGNTMLAPPGQWGTPASVALPSSLRPAGMNGQPLDAGLGMQPTMISSYGPASAYGVAGGTMGLPYGSTSVIGSTAAYGPSPIYGPTSSWGASGAVSGLPATSGAFFQAAPSPTAAFDGGSAPIWGQPMDPSQQMIPASAPAGAIPASPISMPSVGGFAPGTSFPAAYGSGMTPAAAGMGAAAADPAMVISGIPAVQAF